MMGIYDLGTSIKIDKDDPKYYNPPIQDFDIKYEFKGDREEAIPYRPTFLPIYNPAYNHNFMFTPHRDCPTLKSKIISSYDKIAGNHKDVYSPLYKRLIEKGFDPKSHFDRDEYDIELASNMCDFIISNTYSNPEFQELGPLVDECKFIVNMYRMLQLSDNSLR